ncbi:hypothetical protein EVAR_89832_1 [Eumeta japonica]|uniref:Uncharacterized protein n=1 Tax=Eumeta variegata TaxID=151549 RepID=A0A4C2AGS4_EUMVA|nr:hypothetical protein EVAR_89832_1 [Eumeta japonica]
MYSKADIAHARRPAWSWASVTRGISLPGAFVTISFGRMMRSPRGALGRRNFDVTAVQTRPFQSTEALAVRQLFILHSTSRHHEKLPNVELSGDVLRPRRPVALYVGLVL